MMQDPDIGLCFELPGTDHERYLIPEALPANEPDYGIWPADALRFRFSYELLPPGLIPRFIVQTHRNLTDKPTRWRTGVVLGAAGCKILVRGDRDRRWIDISVAGPAGLRRPALNIVLDDLDEVHARNPEIGEKALVLLTDQPELDVSYEHLLKLEERHGLDHTFDPEDADRSYTVRELLEGVRRDPSSAGGGKVAGAGHQISTGANSTVTIVEGGLSGSGTKIAQRIGADDSKASSWSATASWRYFSIACGAGAVLFAILVLLLPSNEWRLIVGGLAALGVIVTAYMLSLNPARYYRRWLSYVLAAGVLANAAGVSIDAYLTSQPLTSWLHWDGAAGWSFNLAWAVIVGLLILGDLKQSR